MSAELPDSQAFSSKKTNLNELAAELVRLLPSLVQDSGNAETVILAKLKPVFSERDEALSHLSPKISA